MLRHSLLPHSPANRIRSLIAVAVACVGLTMMQSTAQASPPSSTNTHPPAKPEHCLVVLGKATPGKSSPVLHEHCSPQPFDREAHLQKPTVKSQLKAAGVTASVLLMRWWSDAYYSGSDPYRLDIYGGAACDSQGYTYFPNPNSWAIKLSSIEKGTPACNLVTVWDRNILNSTTWTPSVGYMGSLNDNAGKVWLRQSW